MPRHRRRLRLAQNAIPTAPIANATVSPEGTRENSTVRQAQLLPEGLGLAPALAGVVGHGL
jgi:hypothetical protein